MGDAVEIAVIAAIEDVEINARVAMFAVQVAKKWSQGTKMTMTICSTTMIMNLSTNTTIMMTIFRRSGTTMITTLTMSMTSITNDDDHDDDDHDDDDHDLLADHDDEEGDSHSPHRKIPTWEETVGILITANMESRSKNPHGGGGGHHRGRGRGGRGR